MGFGEGECGEFNLINLFDGALALVIEIANGFNLIAKKFDADGSG